MMMVTITKALLPMTHMMKIYTMLQNVHSEDRLYESDNSINENNVDDENKIDRRKPVARKSVSSGKIIFTKRQQTLDHKDQVDGMKPAANVKKEEDIRIRNRLAKPS